jgi:hypothetical protein
MMGGVMFLADMFDSDTFIAMKLTKKCLGQVQYQHELSMKNILNGLYIPRAPKSGKRKLLLIRNCS